jgi:hypothetical protein
MAPALLDPDAEAEFGPGKHMASFISSFCTYGS